MENQYQTLMQLKSDEELLKYINEADKYTLEAIEAAVAEMKERNIPVDDSFIPTVIEKRQQQQTPSGNRWKAYITDSADAPQYYSKLSVYLFSVAFTILAGTLLLRRNLIIANNKKAANNVLLFGIGYTIAFLTLMIYISEITNSKSSLALVFNGLGAFILEKQFWNKYLGAETMYRTKPIWKPLIIWVAICAFFILISLMG